MERQVMDVVKNAAQQTARYQSLDDEAAWKQFVRQSEEGPVILFKHDPHCGISAAANQEMERLDADVAVVDVASHNDLAQLIARQTGIRHESPQVLVLSNGKPVWSASHWSITGAAVEKARQSKG